MIRNELRPWDQTADRAAQFTRERETALLRSLGGIPARSRWAAFHEPTFDKKTLEDLVQPIEAIEAARAAIWSPTTMITFWGPTRAGKTSLAAALFSEALASLVPEPAYSCTGKTTRCRGELPLGMMYRTGVHYEDAAFLVARTFSEKDVVKLARELPFVVIDNLGREADGLRQVLADVIEERHDNSTPDEESDAPITMTLITTELDPDQIADRYGSYIYGRLFGKPEIAIQFGASLAASTHAEVA